MRVQNAIFSAVSGQGKRLFMVGDVKQSIYRFRLADPTIFLEVPLVRQSGEGGGGRAQAHPSDTEFPLPAPSAGGSQFPLPKRDVHGVRRDGLHRGRGPLSRRILRRGRGGLPCGAGCPGPLPDRRGRGREVPQGSAGGPLCRRPHPDAPGGGIPGRRSERRPAAGVCEGYRHSSALAEGGASPLCQGAGRTGYSLEADGGEDFLDSH